MDVEYEPIVCRDMEVDTDLDAVMDGLYDIEMKPAEKQVAKPKSRVTTYKKKIIQKGERTTVKEVTTVVAVW